MRQRICHTGKPVDLGFRAQHWHIMGRKTVGEFTATGEVIGEHRYLGVDFAQGYAVHKPQWLP